MKNRIAACLQAVKGCCPQRFCEGQNPLLNWDSNPQPYVQIKLRNSAIRLYTSQCLSTFETWQIQPSPPILEMGRATAFKLGQVGQHSGGWGDPLTNLGLASPFFSGILLSRKPLKTLGKWIWFLKRTMAEKNGKGTNP